MPPTAQSAITMAAEAEKPRLIAFDLAPLSDAERSALQEERERHKKRCAVAHHAAGLRGTAVPLQPSWQQAASGFMPGLPMLPIYVCRAEKFGTDYVDPGRVRKDFTLVMESRREKQEKHGKHGFTTGVDIFSEEEQQKRAARANRFQLEAPLAPALNAYKPDEELTVRARRAAKFGIAYQPQEAVLMDMGGSYMPHADGANGSRAAQRCTCCGGKAGVDPLTRYLALDPSGHSCW